jgi:hypothetical protein
LDNDQKNEEILNMEWEVCGLARQGMGDSKQANK